MNAAVDSVLLRAALRELDVPLAEDALPLFESYARILLEWNQRLNLTRITDPQAIAVQHFADSLAVLAVVPCASPVSQPPGSPSRAVVPAANVSGHRPRFAPTSGPPVRLVDVGSGAGLPGLALRIACPTWRVALVEATAKKCVFLRHVVEVLGLGDVVILNERAEVLARQPEYREQYDLAVARAVAPLPKLVEWLLPFVAPGGLMVVHKGANPTPEIDAARSLVTKLGGGQPSVWPYELPGLRQRRALVVVPKHRTTPARFPRGGMARGRRVDGSDL